MAAKAQSAYLTFLEGDGDDSRWKRVVARLADRLRVREASSAYPLVVVVPPDVPEPHRRILISQGQGCIVREIIEPVCPPLADQQATTTQLAMGGEQFAGYEKLVYLDPDTQVSDNTDDGLFDLETGVLVHEAGMGTAKTMLFYGLPDIPFAEQHFFNTFFKDEYKPIHLEHNLATDTIGSISHLENEQSVVYAAHQLEGQKLPPPPPYGYGSWLATKAATVLARQNLPAMATLAASSAVLGLVMNAANPAVCFAFYAAFLAAIATVTLTLSS